MYLCTYVIGFEELSAFFFVLVILICGGEVGANQREAEVQTPRRPTLAKRYESFLCMYVCMSKRRPKEHVCTTLRMYLLTYILHIHTLCIK